MKNNITIIDDNLNQNLDNINQILPDNTYYFYWYPWAAEIDENEIIPFYNRAPFTTVERKVVTRPNSMGIPTINFGSNNNYFAKKISELFNIINPNQLYLDDNVEDKNLLEKDRKIKENLYRLSKEKNIKIYQAQPYSDTKIQDIYTDSCKKSLELNDKRNLSKWIPQENLLEQRTTPFDEYPYVAKLSRSSAGDATAIIRNKNDQNKFIQDFGKYFDSIPPIYEEYCDGVEYGLEIAIDYKWNPKMLVLVKSAVDENNSYIWWLLYADQKISNDIKNLTKNIMDVLIKKWRYGRWWLDIKYGKDGKRKVIDPNMRITQIMPAAREYGIKAQKNNMIYGSAVIENTYNSTLISISKDIKSDLIKVFWYTEYKGKIYCDLGIYFDEEETKNENIEYIRKKWISLK